MFDLRLIRAEILKLRRRRGMLAIAAVLTLGVVALAFGVSAIQHAATPATYGPAGGAASFDDAMGVLALLATSRARSSARPPAARTSSRACSATWPPPAARASRCSAPASPGRGPWSCRSPPLGGRHAPAPRWRWRARCAAPSAGTVAGRHGRRAGRRRAEQRRRGRARRARRLARHRDRRSCSPSSWPSRRCWSGFGCWATSARRSRRSRSPASAARTPSARRARRSRSRSSPPGSSPPSPPAHGARGPGRSDARARRPGIRSRVSRPCRVAAPAVERTRTSRSPASPCRRSAPPYRAVHDDRPLAVAIAVVAVLPLLVRRRWPFAALAAAAWRDRRDRRRRRRARRPGRALHDRLDAAVARRRRVAVRSSPATRSTRRRRDAVSPATWWPSPCSARRRRARPLRRRPARHLDALRARRAHGRASASCSPSERWPRSGCASRRSCTTSSPTTSASSSSRRRRSARRSRDERVREATDGIADLGRQTMAEMHRTLKLLRARRRRGRARAAAGPRQPRRAARAVARGRASTSGCAVEGEPRQLSQSLDLSAFRIVQEALTNVVQHAGRAPERDRALPARGASSSTWPTAATGAAATARRARRPRAGRDARARRAVRRHARRRPARRPRLRGPRRAALRRRARA